MNIIKFRMNPGKSNRISLILRKSDCQAADLRELSMILASLKSGLLALDGGSYFLIATFLSRVDRSLKIRTLEEALAIPQSKEVV